MFQVNNLTPSLTNIFQKNLIADGSYSGMLISAYYFYVAELNTETLHFIIQSLNAKHRNPTKAPTCYHCWCSM